MEACEEDAEVSEEKRRQFISRTKDESEKLVACNTAVGSMAEEPREGHVSRLAEKVICGMHKLELL